MENPEKPLLIVITPVRNEAWVLEAFLTCTSAWADYIIISDQNSTDGSREIAKRFEKVILLENPTDEWYEMIVRHQLIEKAESIRGNKIIFGLDADEFLSEGFDKTKEWQDILNSKENEIFCFRWLSLFENFKKKKYESWHSEWAAHFDSSINIADEFKKREHHAVHCMRVPCLEEDKCKYILINDIRFVHLARLNRVRTENKQTFYQVTWVDKNKDKWNPISFYRGYTDFIPEGMEEANEEEKLYIMGSDKTANSLVKQSDIGQHYIDEMVKVFKREGTDKFISLNIWDNKYLKEAGFNPIKPFKVKLLHLYLENTQSFKDNFFIKNFDKVLKRVNWK